MDAAPTVLVVGAGSIGERHARCFQQVGGRVAICEPLDSRRSEVAARYKVDRAFASLDEAAEQEWDAVVICTPAQLHIEHACRLAPRTPAVLIEKPLATALDELPRLVAAVAGKTVGVAYVLRHHPAVQAVARQVAEGALGELLQVTMTAGQHFPTFRPAYREIYYSDRATGGGAIQDAATHLFNLVQHLAGWFDWIYCDYAHQALPGVEVEDALHAVGRIGVRGEGKGERAGRAMVSIALNQFMAPNEFTVDLHGAAASARIEFHTNRHGLFRHDDTAWVWSEPLIEHRDDLFRRQARQFLDAAAGSEPPLCGLDEAVHTLRVNLAALASNGERRVEIEPHSSAP